MLLEQAAQRLERARPARRVAEHAHDPKLLAAGIELRELMEASRELVTDTARRPLAHIARLEAQRKGRAEHGAARVDHVIESAAPLRVLATIVIRDIEADARALSRGTLGRVHLRLADTRALRLLRPAATLHDRLRHPAIVDAARQRQ